MEDLSGPKLNSCSGSYETVRRSHTLYVCFHHAPDIWVSGLQEPEPLDLLPHISLADEDDEEEEASEHVAAINNSEEEIDRLEGNTWCTIVVVYDVMNAFNYPKNTKYKEYLQV